MEEDREKIEEVKKEEIKDPNDLTAEDHKDVAKLEIKIGAVLFATAVTLGILISRGVFKTSPEWVQNIVNSVTPAFGAGGILMGLDSGFNHLVYKIKKNMDNE